MFVTKSKDALVTGDIINGFHRVTRVTDKRIYYKVISFITTVLKRWEEEELMMRFFILMDVFDDPPQIETIREYNTDIVDVVIAHVNMSINRL